MARELADFNTRGSIESMSAYLGDAQITAEEFVKYKPSVPLGLLKALGLEANSVPLPTEDPATLIMNATENLVNDVDSKDLDKIEFVEVGTESIKDGSLPMSQYALQFLNHDDVISNETKHACVAAINAIWKNVGDNGLVISSDIATYADDEVTPPSAEFTGGAGSVAMFLKRGGKLLDIINVRGASSSLTHDFFKPYVIQGTELRGKTYPVVFGQYSNLANIERVGKAYESLKKKVNVDLDTFSGIVLHAPYPGITKYNLAFMIIIDQKDEGDKRAVQIYKYINNLIDEAHQNFVQRDFDNILSIEKQVKMYLKEFIYMTDDEGNRLLNPEYSKHSQKIGPSLELIKKTGNLYTGSSPLCMMSLLENKQFEPDEYILWGGYGSGNQAIFMIAKTKNETMKIASTWNTMRKLEERTLISSEDYKKLKEIGPTAFQEIDDVNSNLSDLLRPIQRYYISSCDEYQIKTYEKNTGSTPKKEMSNKTLEKSQTQIKS